MDNRQLITAADIIVRLATMPSRSGVRRALNLHGGLYAVYDEARDCVVLLYAGNAKEAAEKATGCKAASTHTTDAAELDSIISSAFDAGWVAGHRARDGVRE